MAKCDFDNVEFRSWRTLLNQNGRSVLRQEVSRWTGFGFACLHASIKSLLWVQSSVFGYQSSDIWMIHVACNTCTHLLFAVKAERTKQFCGVSKMIYIHMREYCELWQKQWEGNKGIHVLCSIFVPRQECGLFFYSGTRMRTLRSSPYWTMCDVSASHCLRLAAQGARDTFNMDSEFALDREILQRQLERRPEELSVKPAVWGRRCAMRHDLSPSAWISIALKGDEIVWLCELTIEAASSERGLTKS